MGFFMRFDSLMASFLSNQQAVLPTAFVQYAGLYVAWALVLMWGVSALTKHWSSRYRWSVMSAVALLTLVPGPSSPAYWLGLAFQSPSVTSVLLAVAGLMLAAPTRPKNGAADRDWRGLAVGTGLGWVLLLDTLAWWPFSIYAWGFSPATVAVLALTLAMGWAIFGGAHRGRHSLLVFGVPALALVLFVATRWPTGNVWDALIDPWLWVGLQGMVLISAVRAWRLRGAPAIQT